MTTPLFLKSDSFGSFEYSYVPSGGICPPGQQPTAVACIVAPCPDLCTASESMVLSGEPLVSQLPATQEEVTRQQVAEPGGSTPWLSIAIVATLMLLPLAARGMGR